MALDNGVVAGISGIVGAAMMKTIDFLLNKRKEAAKTDKVVIEAKVLTSVEQRKRTLFCEDQLFKLEGRYKEQQEENVRLQEKLKVLSAEFFALQAKTNQTLIDITFLKNELAAYKT